MPYVWKREIDVYDRRLEAISAAAELGSFSRAAAKLRVSTPALVKQVSGFEAEFGIALFERSHSGVKVTPAGALLVDDARSIMRQSEDALRHRPTRGGRWRCRASGCVDDVPGAPNAVDVVEHPRSGTVASI